ncbi:MAG: MGMT family protein [Flammeovirgaceae bacterium]|nr:MGMT family protein [Flammeovirgaceae bacterium]MDW8286565.1 MGMT family protein [Flammeovirgaceae bacterium]
MNRTSFFEDVYQVVRCIPIGRVSTYGAIAAYLGARRSARMVGWALNQAVNDIDIPAHRVVNRNGLLTGKYHFSTPTEMAEKLMAEGVMVENDRVVFFEKVFWNPSIALTL